MSTIVRFLLFYALCAALVKGQDSSEAPNESKQTEQPEAADTARGLASSFELDEKLTRAESQPAALKKNANIYMGIYKNYKSTYLGNKTTNEYKKRLKDRVSASLLAHNEAHVEEYSTPEHIGAVTEAAAQVDLMDSLAQQLQSEAQAEALLQAQTEQPSYDNTETPEEGKKRRKRKRKNRDEAANIQRYHVGPGLNVSLDMSNDIVQVKLDGANLRDILGARWLSADNSEEGRGKKYDMITKVLPLFILPFLIQSAIVPFLVTKLKLLLVKSILVGKLAIFLLIISAIRNSNKQMQTYEVPSYWAGEPSRRSELAAAASSSAYNGYRVEGKPTTWIN